MPDDFGDKTHDATPHRRQTAREQGQVARSQDLSAAMMILAGAGVLLLLGGSVVAWMEDLTRRQLGGEVWLEIDRQVFASYWNVVALSLARVMLPVLGLLMLLGVVLGLVQTGFLFVPDRLVPNLNHINPMSGMSRVFSISSMARLGFGLLKLVVVAAVAYFSLAPAWPTILSLPGMDVRQIGALMVELLLWTSIKIGAALLLLAVLDYGFQRWKHEQDLRMTTQQVREEMKEQYGDPQVLARRRAVHRQVALKQVAADVRKGTTTITNPTELAITIQFDVQTLAAPIVVAKGAGLVAQHIRRLSLEYGIPIVERKPLVRALYKQARLNQPIPVQFYAAAGEVVAYVHNLQRKAS